MAKNVFVLGLTPMQRQELRTVHEIEDCDFYDLVGHDLLVGETAIDFDDLLERARAELDSFDGTVDGIVSHWDFPTSVLGPVLAAERGLPAPSLTSILKCEHKYWSRLEQRRAVPDVVPGFVAFDPFADDVAQQIDLGFPYWVKPVKGHSSNLGFEIRGPQDLDAALIEIRHEITDVGDAFDQVLRRVDLPDELAGTGGTACLAEEIIEGVQVAPEGSISGGSLSVHGVVDMHKDDEGLSIERIDYPAALVSPEVQQRAIDTTERLLDHRAIGVLRLDANPTNYFAETEQVAFHPGHLVPGIDVTDDPLLQGRLFSYLDTQISRLGGPNFGQIPINRPHAPVNDMLRDGMHQTADHAGVAPYRPNSLDGGCPFHAGADTGALIDVPQPVSGPKSREAAASFADHFSQPRMFWLSLTPTEQDHVVAAYTFELGRCYEQAVRERQVQALARIDGDLAAGVASGLGLPAPQADEELTGIGPSPALSQLGGEWPLDGRIVGLVVDEDVDEEVLTRVRRSVDDAGMVPLVIAPTGGLVEGSTVPAQRTLLTARSVEFDAVLLAGSPGGAADPLAGTDARAMDPMGVPAGARSDPRLRLLVAEAYRHGKAVGAWGRGVEALDAVGAIGAAGVVVDEDPVAVLEQVVSLMGGHRVWERLSASA